MIVDLISLFVFGVLAFLGWRSGLLSQVFRIVAIVAVFLGAPLVTPVIKSIFFGETGAQTPTVEVFSLLISGVLIYVTFAVAGWVIVKVIRATSMTLGFLDRFGGASIGAAKALLMIYLAVILVVLMEGPLLETDPENKLRLREGRLTALVNEYNVLAPWQFPDLNNLHQALRIAQALEESRKFEAVRDDEVVTYVLREKRFRELLEDEELMVWVGDDHYPLTLADHRVRELLNDGEFVRRLSLVEWSGLDELVAAEKEEELEGPAA